jgi:adenine/guanine phosphoribosyltransferase-like PRPP-binding protein
VTHDFWQTIEAAGSYSTEGPFGDFYPATLPDRRQLLLPIRVLPWDGDRAVASLILNQASFSVLDALADELTAIMAPLRAEIVVGVPTLGLPLAEAVARRLGHARLVALSTSRKFWYRDEWSEPLTSITTPGGGKRLFIDPRMLPLLAGRRVVVIDDVVSSGRSIAATLRLLQTVGATPAGIGVAMKQGQQWRAALAETGAGANELLHGVFTSPLLQRTADGWVESET